MPAPDAGRNVGDSGVLPNMTPGRTKAGAIKIQGLPATSQFRHWKLSFRDNVAGASGLLDEGSAWTMETEAPGVTLAKLNDGDAFPSFDANLASALSVIWSGAMMRAVNNTQEQSAFEGKLMKMREILFELYQRFRISETEGSILDFRDLRQVKLHNEQLVTFLNVWECILGAMQMLPPKNTLEQSSHHQAHRSQYLRGQLVYYVRWGIGHTGRNYTLLLSAARKLIEQKKTIQAETCPVARVWPYVGMQEGTPAAARQMSNRVLVGIACRGFFCPIVSFCPFAHDPDARARNGKGTGKTNKSSSPSRGSPKNPSSTERSTSPASGSGEKKVCKFYLHGRRCTEGEECESHNPQPCVN